MTHLTQRERTVLLFIEDFLRQKGHSPSIREICKGLGLKSPGSMHRTLKALERKGMIQMGQGKKRVIRPCGREKAFEKVPVLGRIAAGLPIEAQEEVIEEIPCDPGVFGVRDCFALLIKGDSMVEKHIKEGDIAIIQPQEVVEQGEIAAVIVDGLIREATLKVVRYGEESITLISANPRYPPMRFEKGDVDRVRIIGRLVGIIRRM